MAGKKAVARIGILRRFVLFVTILHIFLLSYILYTHANTEVQELTASFLQLEGKHNKPTNRSDVLARRGSSKSISCQWDGDCKPTETWLDRYLGIRRPQSRLLVRNKLSRVRYWCGNVIPPNGTLEVDANASSACSMPPRLFPDTPTLSAEGMPPIEILFNDDNPSLSTKPFECDVPCQTGGEGYLISKLFIRGTPWVFTKSMEGPMYYTELELDPTAYERDNYYSVTSFRSEVPAPYYSDAEYRIMTRPVDFHKGIKGASFLANNCASKNDREQWVQELIHSSFRIDSLSQCFHNAEPPPGVDLINFQGVP